MPWLNVRKNGRQGHPTSGKLQSLNRSPPELHISDKVLRLQDQSQGDRMVAVILHILDLRMLNNQTDTCFTGLQASGLPLCA